MRRFVGLNLRGKVMSNNFEGWKHINSAPKDREILVWDGANRHVVEFDDASGLFFTYHGCVPFPTHWRGCPPPPIESLPDDPD